jgi:hypothetical protein
LKKTGEMEVKSDMNWKRVAMVLSVLGCVAISYMHQVVMGWIWIN